jgi:ubiquinone/menaquinone biosynthesis C-methylase UbiE
MRRMTDDSQYTQQQTPKEYERYYETKYKRADILEKKLLIKLLGMFQNVTNLLEVGCGTGHFTRWMDATELECYGVDISVPMLKEAKKLWINGRLLQAEGSRLPFKDKSIDIVTYITSFEFMPDAAFALGEAARVAKKGVIMGLMNKNSVATLSKRFQSMTGANSFYEGAHFYSISDIKKILDKSFPGKYTITFWRTTVFPRVFGDLESARFSLGAFLGVAFELRDNHE